MKGTALRAGSHWLHPATVNGGPARRTVNKEQHHPFVLSSQISDIRSQMSDHFLHITPLLIGEKSLALSAQVPSFQRDRPPGGPPLVTPKLMGDPPGGRSNSQQTRAVVWWPAASLDHSLSYLINYASPREPVKSCARTTLLMPSCFRSFEASLNRSLIPSALPGDKALS